jgi:hypothetical protein
MPETYTKCLVCYKEHSPVHKKHFCEVVLALEAERDKLREAIKKHRAAFDGNEANIVPEDSTLWAALEAGNEHE